MIKRFMKLPIGAAALLLPVLLCGVLGAFVVPHDPAAIDPARALEAPSWLSGQGWTHAFGTDALGRDVMSRVIVGARATLIVSLVGVVLAGAIGVTLGVVAGFLEGWVDMVIMRLVDIQMSMPGVLLALLISASIGGGLSTVIIVVAIVFWTQYARIARAETLSLKHRDFVAMARVYGASAPRLIFRHILPNLADSILVVASLQLGLAVMLEGALSFLGLGVQPPNVAWGKMIAEARIYLEQAWWVSTFPGLAIVATVLGANLLGEWLRDTLDPKLRNA